MKDVSVLTPAIFNRLSEQNLRPMSDWLEILFHTGMADQMPDCFVLQAGWNILSESLRRVSAV